MKNDKTSLSSACPAAARQPSEKLGKPTGWEFIDADDFVVALEGKTIPDMFANQRGYFRDAEREPLRPWLQSAVWLLLAAAASLSVL